MPNCKLHLSWSSCKDVVRKKRISISTIFVINIFLCACVRVSSCTSMSMKEDIHRFYLMSWIEQKDNNILTKFKVICKVPWPSLYLKGRPTKKKKERLIFITFTSTQYIPSIYLCCVTNLNDYSFHCKCLKWDFIVF